MYKALFFIFLISCSVVAAGLEKNENLDRLAVHFGLVEKFFLGRDFNRELFDNTLKTDEFFKEKFESSETFQAVREKLSSGKTDITKTAFFDALIDDWFEEKSVFLMLAGQLPEDGHDPTIDFLKFSSELAKAMKDAEIKILTPENSRWSEFFADNSGPNWAKAREACPLHKIGNSYSFIHDPLIEYFIVRQTAEEAAHHLRFTKYEDEPPML
jgi:hypothetical protein